MKNRKWFLIASGITLLVSLCVIFPIEKKSEFISDLVYTFITLGLAMLLGMYGLMGKKILGGLLILLMSVIISFISWYIVFYNDFWGIIPAIYGGIPSGIVAGLLFLITDANFLADDNKYKRFIKRLSTYSVLLIIISVLFAKGGDWIFEISEYFKNKAGR